MKTDFYLHLPEKETALLRAAETSGQWQDNFTVFEETERKQTCGTQTDLTVIG